MPKPKDHGLTGVGRDVYLDAKTSIRQIRRMTKPVINNLSPEQKEAFGAMLKQLQAVVEEKRHALDKA